MASYNEIDGIPSHINHWLLERVLRQEWVCSSRGQLARNTAPTLSIDAPGMRTRSRALVSAAS
jgi:hypothetical protein